jgi:trehalose 2-sulfotransferase
MRAALLRSTAHVAKLRRRIESAGIERTFFLCSSPRTGSTMLGNLLVETGLVGRAGEVFGEVFYRDVVPGLSRREFDDYLVIQCARRARETPTLGVKLHWYQVESFLYHLRLRRGLADANDREVIEAVFPSPTFVWMTREDSVAQAVSWWKAMSTGKWTGTQAARAEAEYDEDGIRSRLQRIASDTRAWSRWFDANGVEPLHVVYEELAADPSGEVRRVLEHIGVDVPADLVVVPRTERQADSRNAEWIERYRTAPARVVEPPRVERPSVVDRARFRVAAAAFAVALMLCLLFVALPEELGDWPYNALGH